MKRGTYEAKRARLFADLGRLERLAVAFSGGVDSSVLLHAAHAVLGERATALVADSPSLPRRELEIARRSARSIGVALVEVSTDELSDPRYQANSGDRCYFCKHALFEAMREWARESGCASLAFGEIVDDLSDDRPGARAADEFRVLRPLSKAGFTKEDVRLYASIAGLEAADRPASACLASRVPVGTLVTREGLARVEQAENALHDLGLRQLRVRDHGRHARVEVGADELEFAEVRAIELRTGLRQAGFDDYELHVYRSPNLVTREIP